MKRTTISAALAAAVMAGAHWSAANAAPCLIVTLTGTQGGLILANLVMIPFVALPEDAQLGWGWRVPFWLSAVVVLVAYFIRRTLHEPPAFARPGGATR